MPIRFSLRKYLNPVFIETGTFHGEGVRKALRAGFKKIYSIELNKKYYNELVVKFEKQIKEGRVNLFCGDSLKVLPEILKGIECRVTFWLDAHYCGGDTARGSMTSPLLEELEEIGRHPVRTHTILVDDVRLLGTNANEDWSSVGFDQVVGRIKKINAGYKIGYEKGEVKNDVLAAEIGISPILKIVGFFEELITLPLSVLVRWLRSMVSLKG